MDEPLSYCAGNPASRGAPHFDAESGYLDVTNKAFARPQILWTPNRNFVT